MPTEYKPLKNYDQYGENPFIPDKPSDLVQIRRRPKMVYPTNGEVVHYVVNQNTGEIDGHTAFIKAFEVDETRFVKLFLSELGALWDLSKAALKVFTYVMKELRVNADYIYLYTDDCMEHTGYKSERSVINGITELIEHNIIARSTRPNRYFINPMIVFNGNRVTFAKTYIKKRREQRDTQTIDMFEQQKQLEAQGSSELSEGQERWEEMQQEATDHEQRTGEADTTK